MKTPDCEIQPLFEEGAQLPFDQLVQKLFVEVESAAGSALKTYTEVFGVPPRRPDDLNRVLGQAVTAALPKLIDRQLLRSIANSLNGDLACTSKELRQALAAGGARPVEQDVLYMLLYGFRHGLTDVDIASVPVSQVTFKFLLAPGFNRVQLSEARLEFTSPAAERRYLSTTSDEGSILRTGNAAVKTGAAEIAGALAVLLALPWKELFKCLKDLVDLIKEAFSDKDKIDEALEEIDDALEDIDDELEDTEDDIKEKKDEIKEEDDPEDKDELKEELKELEEKRKNLRDAKKSLNEAKDKLKEAQKKG